MVHVFQKPIELKPGEYRSLARLIYDKSGISLGDHKQEFMKTRLGKRLRALGLDTYAEYFNFVSESQDDGELMLMINAISTNFTSFYRERQHFDFLTGQALPEILRRKNAEKSTRVRAWCAAASTGEEPYTLALTLAEFFSRMPTFDVKLLATDISTKVLAQAMEGVYTFDKVKTVPPALLERYFDRTQVDKESMYQVSARLKAMITFRRLNLMEASFPFRGPFDFISCRNVMIYFDPPTQAAVVDKLLRMLLPGGYLLIGHSENLPATFRTRVDVLAPATYRKIR
jgi:chemotaxis protein methyltransferase CheR